MNDEQPIAWVLFSDGPRPIYEDVVGQFTYDYEGEKTYGVWYVPPEECCVPIVVDSKED